LRQQLIIKSLKDKFLDIGFVSSPSKIKSVYNTLNEHVITDLEIGQIIQLALYIKDLPRENIVSSNLNDSCFYGSSVCEK
jgi:anionic cell wall polymer biosynthesis LytR-Cps2A-Psr (LCP) family protein